MEYAGAECRCLLVCPDYRCLQKLCALVLPLTQQLESGGSVQPPPETHLSESTTHSHTRHSLSTRSAASQTRPQATSVHDCGTSTSHDREHGVGETGARAGHDDSGSSTHNLSDSSSRSWTDGHVGRASISVTANLSPPQDASTPHARRAGGHTSSSLRRQSGRHRETASQSQSCSRVERAELISGGTQTDGLHSSSFHSHTSSVREGGGADDSPPSRRRHDAGAAGSAHQREVGGASGSSRVHHSFSWVHSGGDFDSLETRLQRALDSPTLPVRGWGCCTAQHDHFIHFHLLFLDFLFCFLSPSLPASLSSSLLL